ncbi:MAG: zinc ABC transporter substrate-binding protein, partial [Actinomycetia bacterium]|nr:zinc ABC transporter substrate-binding protein [Actinomycetes bacterium]
MTPPATTSSPGSRRHTHHHRWALLGALVTMVLFVASCSADDTPPGDVMPTVAATTSIWADVVGEATCNLVAIETLIPLGADPHAFEPSLADRHLMDSAELIVANGLFLEEGLHDTIESAHESGTPVFYFAEHVDTISYSAVDHDDDHDDDASDEHGHESGDDPHVWFDPTVVAAALDDLAGHLIDDVGLAAVDVDRCVGAYQNRLGELDAEIEAIVDNIPPDNRKLVTSHDSLGYFADRYGFEVIGTVIPTPSGLAETNPAQLDELSHIIEAAGVRAIFTERQASDEDAVALADRLDNVAVVALHSGSLGDPASGADTYVSMMRSNARLIGEALAEANTSSPLAIPETESANPITDQITYWVEPFT